jgi:hypothetical protein
MSPDIDFLLNRKSKLNSVVMDQEVENEQDP